MVNKMLIKSKNRLIKLRLIFLLVLSLASIIFSWNHLLTSKKSNKFTENSSLRDLLGQNKSFICSNTCEKQIAKPVISNLYEQHNPIVIKNNNDFLTQGFVGTGTFDDPFLIEELRIASSAGYLIEIRNTTAWFVIRNNLLDGLNTSMGGIYLSSVTNGIISGNIIYNNDEYGIYAAYSSNSIMINNNTLFDNSAGIGVTRSVYDIRIINNTVFNNLKWNAILASYEAHNIFIANNTLFNSGWHGILLWGSTYNNTVINNTAYNNTYKGIWVANYCSENTVLNNTFYDNKEDGIGVSYSDRNTISSNTIFGNLDNGIEVDGSDDNTISRNIIHNNKRSGISIIFDYSNYFASINNSVEFNTVFDNGENGIVIKTSAKDNDITSNTVHGNKGVGISLRDESNDNLIAKNILHNNSIGIKILNSSNNRIISNEISNHTDYGLTINSINRSNSNIIEQNNFLGNNYNRETQAHDNGSNNIFIHNYWDDWEKPDLNNDDFVDEPYAIDGSANTTDFYPSATLIDITHWITIPRLITPTAGEIINGSYIIQWTPTMDPLDHEITYSVYLSSDNGETWILIVSELSVTNYTLNTRLFNDSGSYRLKIQARCSAGRSVTIISISAFTIQNVSTVGNNDLIIQIFSILAAGILIIFLGYFWLKFRSEKPKSFYEIIQAAQLDFLQTIHQKVVIALDNISLASIKAGVIPEAVDMPSMETPEELNLVEYFPSDFRDDLVYEMKGRTVLTLIEIACQYPHETNPTRLSRILKIPPSTLSADIKRLIKLQYIEHHVEISRDARYRVYSVTIKGYRFLYTMKSALEISIIRLKERHVGS